MRTAIIQLASFGDLASMLPFAKYLHDTGDDVSVIVHPDFAAILEAVSYVTPILYNGETGDVEDVVFQAGKMGFDKIISCQVHNKPEPNPDVASYQLSQWARAGFADRFHELPLVFDRRDVDGEAESVSRHVPPPDGRPLLVVNFSGFSSRYEYATAQAAWVHETFGASHRVLDLSGIRLDKIHHLLGILDLAECLITIDTATLHLAYATSTPTIALCPGRTPYGQPSIWFDSEPRSHWIGKFHYRESLTDATHEEIKRIIRHRDFALGRKMRDIVLPKPEPIIVETKRRGSALFASPH